MGRERPKTNLAPERTSFVGRAGEIDALAQRLTAGARLVTVLGPPGAGKTRLCRRYAATELAKDPPPGGIWFCDLTEARTAGEVAAAVASALEVGGLGRATAPDAAGRVGAALAARGRSLVLLDNFEGVVAHARDTVSRWLDLAPVARFLVSSRQRLALPGEICITLPPLPDEDALRLFGDRATAVGHGFFMSDAVRPLVRELVQRLDGLPLAIELAAARVNVLPPAELLARLDERLDLLAPRSDRPSAARAGLRGALDVSFRLLPPWGQDALAQCSVFRGGFSLAAAAAVLDLGGHADAPPVPDVLAALCDRSLVHSQPLAALPGEARFGLYESIREYAAQTLDANGGRAAAENRHADHYAGRPGRDGLAATLRAEPPAAALARLGLENDNLSAIYHRFLAAEPERAARAVLAQDPNVRARGPIDEHILRSGRAAAALPPAEANGLRARLLAARGYALMLAGRADEACADLVAARGLAQSEGATQVEAEVHTTLGLIHQIRGEFQEARSWLERSAALGGADGAPPDDSLRLRGFGLLQLARGSLEEATSYFGEALDASRRTGDRRNEGLLRAVLAMVWHEQGRFLDARQAFEEGLGLLRETGYRWFEGVALLWKGLLELDEGRMEEAALLLAQAEAVVREVGDRWFLPAVRGYRGVVSHFLGSLGDAQVALEEAVLLARREKDQYRSGIFLPHLGAVLARLDARQSSRQAFAEGQAVAAASPNPNLRHTGEVLAGFAHLAERADTAGAAACLPLAGDGPAARSSDVRIAARLLRSAIEAQGAPALVLDREARWFAMPGRRRVDIARRRTLRLLLKRLVERRLESPGAGLTSTDLVAAGWPGEKMLPDAGAPRVYVAIAALRKLDLDDVLLTRDDGYLIDPRVRVAWAPAQTTRRAGRRAVF